MRVELIQDLTKYKIERQWDGQHSIIAITEKLENCIVAYKINGVVYIGVRFSQDLVEQIVSVLGRSQIRVYGGKPEYVTDKFVNDMRITFTGIHCDFAQLNSIILHLRNHVKLEVLEGKVSIAQDIAYKRDVRFVPVQTNMGVRNMIDSHKLIMIDGIRYHKTRSTSFISIDCVTGEWILNSKANRVEVKQNYVGYTTTKPISLQGRKFANTPETMTAFQITKLDDGTYTRPMVFEHSHMNIQGDCKVGLGFEIEKEDEYIKELYDYNYNDLLHRTGWSFEGDGSLDDETGFECISPVLGMDLDKPVSEQTELLARLDDVRDILDADYSTSCGGHINVSVVGMSQMQLLDSVRGFIPLLYALYPNRENNTYSEFNYFKDYKNREKFAAINVKSYAVEFRVFPAVENMKSLLWRTELIRIMLSNECYKSQQVLAMLANKSSALYQHLKNYYDISITELINNYVYYANLYNGVIFTSQSKVAQDVESGSFDEIDVNDPMLKVA